MRPDWWRCDSCIFYVCNGEVVCNYHPGGEPTIPAAFCNRWRCGKCQGEWDDGEQHDGCMFIEVELANGG
jgi:hypothetical protein